MVLVTVGAKRLLSVSAGQFFRVLKNTTATNPSVVDATVDRAVEGTWYRGMTFTPEVSSIERYLTIPLDFFPALYSTNALVGVAEGVHEEGENMAHFMGSGDRVRRKC